MALCTANGHPPHQTFPQKYPKHCPHKKRIEVVALLEEDLHKRLRTTGFLQCTCCPAPTIDNLDHLLDAFSQHCELVLNLNSSSSSSSSSRYPTTTFLASSLALHRPDINLPRYKTCCNPAASLPSLLPLLPILFEPRQHPVFTVVSCTWRMPSNHQAALCTLPDAFPRLSSVSSNIRRRLYIP